MDKMKKRIGIIIGKIGGIDGVALEAEKWIHVLKKLGHEVFVLTGLVERKILDKSHVEENHKLSFYHKENLAIQKNAFDEVCKDISRLRKRIDSHADKISRIIADWIKNKKIDIVISENASSLPFNLALGIAIKKIVDIEGTKVISHNHDFWWERGKRYKPDKPSIRKIIEEAFPLKRKTVKHVIINKNQKKYLKDNYNIESIVIPNVMDFSKKFGKVTKQSRELKKDLGLDSDDILIFQITRIIPRKKIETAIELIKRLKNPKIKLIITGVLKKDLNKNYLKHLKSIVKKEKLEKQIIFAGNYFDSCSNFISKNSACKNKNTHGTHSLNDAYANADGCSYFSSYEGFGNAFIEAILAKKPIFVNNYKPVYWDNIGNKGFKTIMIEDNRLTNDDVEKIRKIISNKKLQIKIGEYNYKIGKKYFSYGVLEKKLKKLIK